MRDHLISYKFWNANNINTLLNQYATRQGIHDAILAKSAPLLFFFAGHGGSTKSNPAAPADGLLPYTSDLTVRINPSDLQSWLHSATQNTDDYTVFLDACHSGMFPDQIQTNEGVISSACAELEYTEDDFDWQHGVYTHFLLLGLENQSITTAVALHNSVVDPVYQREGSHPQLKSYYNDFDISGPTLSGNFFRSESWGGNLTLRGNVSIGQYVLVLPQTTTLNFNGFYLKAGNGSITVQNNISCVYLKQGSTLKGLFPGLSEALNLAVSGQTVEIHNTQSLSSNITVPTGITLNIASDGIINLNSYYIVVWRYNN